MHWHKMLTVDPQVSYMYSFELTYRSMQILVYSCSTDQFLMQMQNLFLYQMPFCMLLNNLNISNNLHILPELSVSYDQCKAGVYSRRLCNVSAYAVIRTLKFMYVNIYKSFLYEFIESHIIYTIYISEERQSYFFVQLHINWLWNQNYFKEDDNNFITLLFGHIKEPILLPDL